MENKKEKNVRNIPLTEKYRPIYLSDIAAHKDILQTVTKLSEEKRMPHLIFYGPPGTGKTSTILALSRQIYRQEESCMVLDLNASDDRGIDVVRNIVKTFVSTRSLTATNHFKLVILDECDAMTKEAQAALRRIIEKFTFNARFCLICNNITKIIPAIQSRCTRFRFAPMKKIELCEKLNEIISKENMHIDQMGMKALIRLSRGDMRCALNTLHSIQLTTDKIDEKIVYGVTGYPDPTDIDNIISSCLKLPLSKSFRVVSEIQLKRGFSLLDIVREIIPHLPKIKFSHPVLLDLLETLAEIEDRLACGADEIIQRASFIAAIVLGKNYSP